VIDTATKAVVGTPIPVGTSPSGIAITPDGKHAYITIFSSNNVLVIDTATNTAVGSPIPVGTNPRWVAITPDGKQAYVTNQNSNTVSVIDTTANTVVGTPIPLGTNPFGVVVTPDGKHAYVTNASSGNVSVIDTATNTVVGTPIPVGTGPIWLGITPPVQFRAFSAKLAIQFGGAQNQDAFNLQSQFTLSSPPASNGINPATEPVTLQVGTFGATIPPGSFKANISASRG
jgi:YVTN family beta-propeller protein